MTASTLVGVTTATHNGRMTVPYRIVLQPVSVNVGGEWTTEFRPVKVIGKAPNETGKPNDNGDVEPFINIPPIIRLYIGNDSWDDSPEVIPPYSELEATDFRPVVWTLTLNPRTGNFNLHYGFGQGVRTDINPLTGERKAEKLKPDSGNARAMVEILAARQGFDRQDAQKIVALMTVEMINLNNQIAAKQEANADKPKPARPKQRKPSKAEIKAAQQEARLLQWAASRQVA